MAHPALGPRCFARLRMAALALLPAQVAATALPEAALERASQLAVTLARQVAPEGARVLAVPGQADPRLKLAPCTEFEARPSPGAPAWGRTRILLRCSRGPVVWQVSWPVTVQVWAPAWVALAALPAGGTLGKDSLGQAVVDWAAAAVPPLGLDTDPAGRLLVRPLAAGSALRESDLRARQWFNAGDAVQVTLRGEGFAVAAEAVAITPGIEGRPATLKNMAGRSFVAVPMGAGRAEVRL